MSQEGRNAPGQVNASSTEAERARLRRNQRNSRARKQAYIESLESRWSECVRLGAQATVEMQKEAQRVQEENRLLRTVLRNQGLDDNAIKRAIDSARLAEGNLNQAQNTQSDSAFIPHVDEHAPPSQWPSTLSLAERSQFSDNQGDLSQSLDLNDWLSDLCNIKDAFGAEVNFNDPVSQNDLDFVGLLPEDPMQVAIMNNTQYELPPLPMSTAYPSNGSTTSTDGQWAHLDCSNACRMQP
ncbi:hypothetical protein F5Y13DRAFT_148962 [Hypoxylon sp. FL1857]|nr:hypothetical protein F5Y13DRAFT_148962 [Hypoxylon sp. FL1857]